MHDIYSIHNGELQNPLKESMRESFHLIRHMQ